MTGFWAGVAALLAVAMWFVVRPLLRQAQHGGSADRAGANLAVLRDQMAELDSDFTDGRIGAEQHASARAEIERRVLEEVTQGERPQTQGGSRVSAMLLAAEVPVCAGGLYIAVGNPGAINPPVAGDRKVTPQQVEEMVERLAKSLEAQPDNAQGWLMLARSYGVMQRFDQASKAYARAAALSPTDPQLLADYADVLAMTQGNKLEGEPMRLIEKSLQLDPGNVKALALAGSAAYDRRDFSKAIDFWERAAKLSPPESDFTRALVENLGQARALAQAGPTGSPSTAGPVAGTSAISGRVTLDRALAAKVAPTDTVFVYARAAEGPRMPLAISRFTAGELPISFSLDDSMAMTPTMTMSKFSSVVVIARVSKSGDAITRPGDLFVESAPVKPGSSNLVLDISKIAQ